MLNRRGYKRIHHLFRENVNGGIYFVFIAVRFRTVFADGVAIPQSYIFASSHTHTHTHTHARTHTHAHTHALTHTRTQFQGLLGYQGMLNPPATEPHFCVTPPIPFKKRFHCSREELFICRQTFLYRFNTTSLPPNITVTIVTRDFSETDLYLHDSYPHVYHVKSTQNLQKQYLEYIMMDARF